MNRQVRKPKSKNRLKESIDSSNTKENPNKEDDDGEKDILHQHDPEKCEEAFKSNSKIDQMTQDREARIKKMVDESVKYKYKEKAFKENN